MDCGTKVEQDISLKQEHIDAEIGGGVVAMMVVAFFFFLACEDFGRMFDNSFPTCAFFFFFLSGDWFAQTNSTL